MEILPYTRHMKKILIVEDESRTAKFIAEALQEDGFNVEICADGAAGYELAQREAYACVVLDIMLPGRDGLTVVRDWRRQSNSVPVLMLSARGGVEQRVEGLDAGADDYLPKPFSVTEVVARVRALTRRSGEQKTIELHISDLTLNAAAREVRRSGKRVDLSPREFKLLEVLMRQQGHICSRSMLLAEAWDYQFDPGTNLVDVYVRRIRDKVDYGHDEKLIHTVKGVGYVMHDGRAATTAKPTEAPK
jgi:DNA-binding response OmpR family regulator